MYINISIYVDVEKHWNLCIVTCVCSSSSTTYHHGKLKKKTRPFTLQGVLREVSQSAHAFYQFLTDSYNSTVHRFRDLMRDCNLTLTLQHGVSLNSMVL